MLIRLAIIMSLLVQPLLFSAALWSRAGTAVRSGTCCCAPVAPVADGCCAPQHTCGCEAAPAGPLPDQREPAALTVKEAGTLSLPLRALSFGFAHAEQPRTPTQALELDGSEDHNRLQSLLGVWRR